jgi:hypothetical protein
MTAEMISRAFLLSSAGTAYHGDSVVVAALGHAGGDPVRKDLSRSLPESSEGFEMTRPLFVCHFERMREIFPNGVMVGKANCTTTGQGS